MLKILVFSPVDSYWSKTFFKWIVAIWPTSMDGTWSYQFWLMYTQIIILWFILFFFIFSVENYSITHQEMHFIVSAATVLSWLPEIFSRGRQHASIVSIIWWGNESLKKFSTFCFIIIIIGSSVLLLLVTWLQPKTSTFATVGTFHCATGLCCSLFKIIFKSVNQANGAAWSGSSPRPHALACLKTQFISGLFGLGLFSKLN